ncbi:hypothetical protein EDD94_7994 [Streptomyces sp. PanSC9]|nr:hypothetical protein EDD94_7994 [Streptomyces sp. PanSC9]
MRFCSSDEARAALRVRSRSRPTLTLVRHETKLANSYKNTMREVLAVSALTIDSDLGTVSLESWNSDCAPNCKVEYSSSFDGATTWTGLSDHHWAAAS